jgi:hypothetical protein
MFQLGTAGYKHSSTKIQRLSQDKSTAAGNLDSTHNLLKDGILNKVIQRSHSNSNSILHHLIQ